MAIMEPWQSWGVVAVVGASAYWYYTKQKQDTSKAARSGPTAGKGIPSGIHHPEGTKKRYNSSGTSNQIAGDIADVAPVSVTSSGKEKVKQRKGGKKKRSGLAGSSAVDVPSNNVPTVDDRDGDGDDEVDNKEFAKQLSGVKAGTSLNTASTAVRPPRTKKQSQINGSAHMGPDTEAINNKNPSGTSSTTGADADDDMSSANSSALGAINHGAAGVSDMLEAPSPGPSILRLTEPVHPQRPSAPKQSKSIQAQETKKQRQNKAKNEAKKAEREQAEKERRVLLERQLRTAREAEGRPAKNGVAIPTPLKTNAWPNSSNGTVVATSTPANRVQTNGDLLDTFDDTPKVETGNKLNNRLQHDPEVSDGDSKLSDLNWPSEEEQMRMLDEMDGSGSWQTVNPKKKATGKKDESVKSDAGGKREAVVKNEEQERKKPKVEEYLPYKNFDHPENSDWAVVA
ncbi:hypothetical protein MMC26_006287 [Xylographa opegraphella]|nr:hypothetical protein [Xylographa opegraphella]